MSDKVLISRNGKKIEIDRQVWLWRKRRRKAKKLAKERKECFRAVFAHFGGDETAAAAYLDSILPRYKDTVFEMIKKNRLKAVYRALRELKPVADAPTPSPDEENSILSNDLPSLNT